MTAARLLLYPCLLVAAFLSDFLFVSGFSANMATQSLTSAVVGERLKELGLDPLPAPTAPKGSYVPCVRTSDGRFLHLCGHIPQRDDGTLVTGTLGKDLSVEDGYESAKRCAVGILSTIQNELKGDWSRLVKIVKVVGFVQCTNDFEQQPSVINGASDFFVEVLGKDAGSHARSAVGTNALPLNIATEVECIVEINPE